MSPPGAHRARPEWKLALEISEAVYRLALPLAGSAPRLSDQLTAAAAALPSAVARGEAKDALLTLETLLLLAVRLQAVPEAGAAGLIARLDQLYPGSSAPAVPSQKPAAPQKSAASPPTRSAAAPPVGAPSPPERLLVDASNFLGRAPGYALGDEAAKDRLLFRLQDYVRRHPSHKVTAFFDGQRTSTRTLGGVEERITSGLHNADDVIVDSVRALPKPDRKRCLVVTDDRGLASRIRSEGVRVESVAWLTARLVEPASSAARSSGMSRDELSEWEEFFSKPPQRPGK